MNPLINFEFDQAFVLRNGDHRRTRFLREGIEYYFPDYICILSHRRNKLTFHLLVEDVLPNSSKFVVDEDERSVCVKFCVIKLNPNEARHYAFMVKLPVFSLEDVRLLVTSQMVILTIPFTPDGEFSWYLCGLTDSQLKKFPLEDYQIRMDDTSIESADSPSEEDEDWTTTEC